MEEQPAMIQILQGCKKSWQSRRGNRQTITWATWPPRLLLSMQAPPLPHEFLFICKTSQNTSPQWRSISQDAVSR